MESERMQYQEYNDVTDDYLCQAAFVADGAPNLWVAAAWAVNGSRTAPRIIMDDDLSEAEEEEDLTDE